MKEGKELPKKPNLGTSLVDKSNPPSLKFPSSNSIKSSIFPSAKISKTKRVFTPLDLSSLPKTPPLFQPKRISSDNQQSSSLTKKFDLKNQIKEIKDKLTPPPPTLSPSSSHQTFHSEIHNAFKTRGQIIEVDNSNFLECKECLIKIDWPTHCFNYMTKESTTLHCLVCNHARDFPIHCNQPMSVISETNSIAQLLQLAEKKEKDFDYQTALQLYNSAIVQIKEDVASSSLSSNIEKYTLHRAYCLLKLNRFSDAEAELKDIRAILSSQDDLELLSQSLLHLSELYIITGDHEKSEQTIQETHLLLEEVANYPLLAKYYLLKGTYQRIRGEYQESLSSLKQAEQFYSNFSDQINHTETLLQLGILSKELGKFDNSFGYFNVAIKLNSLSDIQTASNLYYHIIMLALDQNKRDIAYQQFNDLKMLYLDHKNDVNIAIRYKLAEAMIQKTSDRMIDKAKALETLTHMIENHEYVHFEQHIFLMTNIADLLLQELQAFESEDALRELESIITRLKSISKTEGSTIVYVQSSILQIKLKMITFDYGEADSLLNELEEYTQNHKLINEHKQVNRLQEFLREQMKRIDDVSQKNQSLRDRMQKNDIDLYIKLAMNYVKNSN